jgi:hypothetical protein
MTKVPATRAPKPATKPAFARQTSGHSAPAHTSVRMPAHAPAPTQAVKDGRTLRTTPIVEPRRERFAPLESFADYPATGDESFGDDETFTIPPSTPRPTKKPGPWTPGTPSPLWHGDNLTGPLGYTPRPATNPPQYDGSTAILDKWNSTLVQDSDNFLLANADDVTFQKFQDAFFH